MIFELNFWYPEWANDEKFGDKLDKLHEPVGWFIKFDLLQEFV